MAGGLLLAGLGRPAIANAEATPKQLANTLAAATDTMPVALDKPSAPLQEVAEEQEPAAREIVTPSAIPQPAPQPLTDYLVEQPSQSAQDLTAQAPAERPRPLIREAREDIDSFKFSVFNWIAEPTALQGTARRRPVSTSIKSTGIALLGSAVLAINDNSHLGLVLEAGENILAFDLGFISADENPRSGFGVNVFNQRSHQGAYLNGDNELDLPNDETPWLHRLGLGAEYYLPFADNFESAIGLTYQRVSLRDDPFTSDVFAFDEDGNALTVDGDGIDDLLTLNLSAVLDNRIRPTPTLTVGGDVLRFGVNQGFNLGEEDNTYTQIVGNYTHYLPLRLFAFDDGPRILILNVQGGIGLGDVPSYEGFNLGGRNSVRGYSGGELSTAASFLQATAEYRFPVAQLEFRNRPVFLRGVLFADFASDLGTADDVVGEPAVVRDKPGDGFGFGFGLHTIAGDLYNRLELGFSDDGDVDLIFTFGDRF